MAEIEPTTIGGLLDPKGNASRAEVAQVMQNLVQKASLIEVSKG